MWEQQRLYAETHPSNRLARALSFRTVAPHAMLRIILLWLWVHLSMVDTYLRTGKGMQSLINFERVR